MTQVRKMLVETNRGVWNHFPLNSKLFIPTSNCNSPFKQTLKHHLINLVNLLNQEFLKVLLNITLQINTCKEKYHYFHGLVFPLRHTHQQMICKPPSSSWLHHFFFFSILKKKKKNYNGQITLLLVVLKNPVSWLEKPQVVTSIKP